MLFACPFMSLSSMMSVMNDQPEDNGENDEYNIFKQDYASLEVAEEDAPKRQTPKTQKPRRNKITRTKLLKAGAAAIIALILLAGLTLVILAARKRETSITINTQSLDNGTLNQLTDATGGEARQQLTISPETLFKENVIIQGSAEVQQDLTVNNTLTVKGLTELQGAVTVEEAATLRSGLTVGGSAAIGGNLSVTGSITAASISVGSISISTVNVAGDVSFGGHLIPNGAAPSARPSVAASGGNVTVSGNDTAGTIVINVGSGATLSGELAIITFNKAFNATPKVQLTPINTAASSLNYYATRSAGFFTINTSNTPTNGAIYVFDYLVTQ